MATAMYLEHYLDSIESLPFEVQRNFSLMTDLDSRTEVKKAEIESLAAEYSAKVKNLSSEERLEYLKRIDNAYSKCREFSDDKVQLALQIYELVDKHIRRLDADLARFESELKDKLDSSSQDSPSEKKSRKGKNSREKRRCGGRGQKGSSHDSPKHAVQNSSEALLAGHPSDVLDMPVDPNEPTYCLCAQVSYGEMIGCDNADGSTFGGKPPAECQIEWFHFACVGLSVKPKGEWFCPPCAQERRK